VLAVVVWSSWTQFYFGTAKHFQLRILNKTKRKKEKNCSTFRYNRRFPTADTIYTTFRNFSALEHSNQVSIFGKKSLVRFFVIAVIIILSEERRLLKRMKSCPLSFWLKIHWVVVCFDSVFHRLFIRPSIQIREKRKRKTTRKELFTWSEWKSSHGSRRRMKSRHLIVFGNKLRRSVRSIFR
jgi:hypothetical protein